MLGCILSPIDMYSRASRALFDAFLARGAQAELARRTKVSQSRLSRLATEDDASPSLETAQRLAADTELPIPIGWWKEPARRVKARRAA